jgi:hypothetical protein
MKALAACLLLALPAAAVTPAVFQSAPGRFEVAATEADAARIVTAAAQEGWRILAAPFGLPDAFSTPVFVRLVPGEEWREAAPFRALVEPGGVVYLRIQWRGRPPEIVLRRALVQGLLLRLAVAEHGGGGRLGVPLWLEHAAARWWETRADAAQLDQVRQASARLAPPPLPELFAWRRGGEEPVARGLGALWLMTFLAGEGAGGAEWRALVRRLLAGEEALAALATGYPGRFGDARDRELWWSTGFHHVRRARTLPTLEAAESRVELAALARFVAGEGERDVVVPLATALAHGREPFVAAELQRRAADLARALPALHPFYRNAGLSLAEALAAGGAEAARRDAAWAAFERDWRDATGLEAAATAALDALERRAP